MDSEANRHRNSSIPAGFNPVRDEHVIHPDHISSPSCWCGPVEVEPGVWLHHPAPQAIPLEDREPQLDGYVPDIKGHIEGDDASTP